MRMKWDFLPRFQQQHAASDFRVAHDDVRGTRPVGLLGDGVEGAQQGF